MVAQFLARTLALFGWVAPVVSVAFLTALRFSSNIPSAGIVSLILVLLLAIGFLSSLAALIMLAKVESQGVLMPALIGLACNIFLIALFAIAVVVLRPILTPMAELG